MKKLKCIKANKWVILGKVYDIVEEKGGVYFIEGALPIIKNWRENPQIELVDVCIDDLKFYCGQPTGTAEFELIDSEVAL